MTTKLTYTESDIILIIEDSGVLLTNVLYCILSIAVEKEKMNGVYGLTAMGKDLTKILKREAYGERYF